MRTSSSPKKQSKLVGNHRNQRRLLLESLENRQLLAGDGVNPFHNEAMPTDVNGNGQTTAIDALNVINSVARHVRSMGEDGQVFGAQSLKPDVNGDGKIQAIDALMVINKLSRDSRFAVQFAAAQGEGSSTLSVTNSLDSGPGSLRQAILSANASSSDTVIQFAIPTGDLGFVDVDASLADGDAAADVFRIQPLTDLPRINNTAGKKITIDATSQVTMSGDTNPRGPEVQIDNNIGILQFGFDLRTRSEIRGFAITRFLGDGVYINGSNIVVAGNYLGVHPTGLTAAGNFRGVFVEAGSNIVIGGDGIARNIISGNTSQAVGINNANIIEVSNNLIGLNAVGAAAVPNGSPLHDSAAINIGSSRNVSIGKTGFGNIIAGNRGSFARGIAVYGSEDVSIQSNVIGTNQSQSVAIANSHDGILLRGVTRANIGGDTNAGNTIAGNEGGGIAIEESQDVFVESNRIGTNSSGENLGNKAHGIAVVESTNVEIGTLNRGNHIAFNNFYGIQTFGYGHNSLNNEHVSVFGNTVEANFLGGLTIARTSSSTIDSNTIKRNGGEGVAVPRDAHSITITGNSIFENVGIGIDLGHDGITLNDPGDTDSGPNGFQNFPVLTFSGSTFSGTLNSQASKTYKIEVFRDSASGLAAVEGKTRIHTATVTTDAIGNASFTIPSALVSIPSQITATATSDDGSTSEFSIPLYVGPVAEVSVDNLVITNGANLSLGAAATGTIIERVVVVTNRGTSDLVLQPATPTGSFNIVSNFAAGQILAPGSSASLSVRSTTTVAGTHLGSLRLISSDASNPEQSFPLGLSLVNGLNLVKDINPGPASSIARQLTVLNGKLALQATQPGSGAELWTSDLTSAGTVLVKDIRPGNESSEPRGLVTKGGELFFAASDSGNGYELWKSDGTPSNTSKVLAIDPADQVSILPNLFVTSSGAILFTVGNSTNGFKLWRSDGTASGTSLLKDIPVSEQLSVFVELNGKTYFSAFSPESGSELWVTDGTAAGTLLVKDLLPGPQSSSPSMLGVANGKLFFSTFIDDGEIWTTDGTSTGTIKVADVEVTDFIGVINDQIFFSGYTDASGDELWKSDGTAAGTSQVIDILAGAESGVVGVGATAAFNNKLYFHANNGSSGTEVWETDGTSTGTKQLLNLNPLGSAVDTVLPLQLLDGQLVIGGNDGRIGQELWTFDLRLPDTTKPTSRVNALPSRSTSTSFNVTVTGSDPIATGPTQIVSGVKEYDLFVATGNGAFVKFATVPASNPSTTFTGQNNATYFFRSLARDNAGNVESKPLIAETQTYVPDLTAPVTAVTAVTSTTPDFVIAFEGTDAGGSGLTQFSVFVSVDGTTPVSVAEVLAGVPNTSGMYSGQTTFRAIADGVTHSYRFFTVGRDGNGNVESASTSGDVTISKSFAAPASLAATGLDVQRGAKQRSFIRNVDLQFNSQTGLQSLLDTVTDGNTTNDRLTLKRFAKDGSGSGQAITLNSTVLTRDGSKLAFDFGAAGIGGNANSAVGDGYYEIGIDTDGNGTTDQRLRFYRLLGDTNGDRKVDNTDVKDVAAAIRQPTVNPNADLNGDGKVDATDRYFASLQRNSFIAAGLPLDD